MRYVCSSFAGPSMVALGLCLASPAFGQAAASDYTTGYRYDISRQLVGTISPDPDGAGPLRFAAVRNSYDAAGRLIKVETGELSGWQPESVAPSAWTGFTIFKTVDNVYDVAGRKIKETVSAGGQTQAVAQMSYDMADQVICTAVRMNPDVFGSLPGDACSLGTQGVYGADRITKNTYIVPGRLQKVQKAFGTPLQQDYVSYTYTANGQKLSVTDANGTTAQYAYDGLDRLQRWYFASKTTSGVANPNDYEEYGYDASGNRTSLRKRDGRTFSFAYDPLGRMTSKLVPDACVGGYACTNVAAAATRDVYYAYDLRGLQLSARFDSTVGTDAVVNSYDSAGRLSSTSTSMGGVTRALSYQWDRNGNRTRVTHPDGSMFDYAYDGLNRLATVYEGAQASGIYMVTIGYDAQGRRAGQTGRYGDTTSYGYDIVGRLSTLADNLGGTSGDITTTLGYNPANQMTTRTRTNDAFVYGGDVSLTRLYTVNGLNQYLTAGAATFGYDANGNLVSDGSLTLTYDAENRLVASQGAKTASLVWDPLGRLYETSGGAQGITRFLYDGDELIGEYNSAGTMLRRYVHGVGADDPLLWYEGANMGPARWYHTDHQGSIVSLSDSTTALVAINRYDDWGVPDASNMGRFQYTGQAWLPELGMYHYKARIYSPTLGRFLQTDPIGYDDQINLYAYVGNDPVNGTDSTGTCRDRGTNGGCLVFVEKGGGERERSAAQALANRLTKLDGKINGLSDKQKISITDAKGRVVGSITGGELKSVWNNQRWSVARVGTEFGRRSGNFRGATDPDRQTTRLTPSGVFGYGRNDKGITTTTFHEVGHVLRQGRDYMPTFPSENEARVHSVGAAISRSVDEGFRCDVGYGCD